MDIKLLLESLEKKLAMMDLDHDDPEYKFLEVRFEENQRHLKLCHRRLQKYKKMRDELATEEAG